MAKAWTAAEIDALDRLWREGLRAKAIARGTGHSPWSVVQKARQRGLPGLRDVRRQTAEAGGRMQRRRMDE